MQSQKKKKLKTTPATKPVIKYGSSSTADAKGSQKRAIACSNIMIPKYCQDEDETKRKSYAFTAEGVKKEGSL